MKVRIIAPAFSNICYNYVVRNFLDNYQGDKDIKSILTAMSVLLLLLPYTLLADDWTGNEWCPVSNFSFEVYNKDTHLFNGWAFGGSEGEVGARCAYALSENRTSGCKPGDGLLSA